MTLPPGTATLLQTYLAGIGVKPIPAGLLFTKGEDKTLIPFTVVLASKQLKQMARALNAEMN